MKKIILFFLLTPILCPHAQIGKSFNYNGNNTIYTGTYIEKHPNENTYFVATQKLVPGKSKTSISKIDENGNTLWHSGIEQIGTTIYFSAVGDLVIYDNTIYVSVYSYPSLPTSSLNIYKFDLDGSLLDSLVIPSVNGLRRYRSEMIVNAQNELVTCYKNNDYSLRVCRIDPVSLTLLDEDVIGYSTFDNTYAPRSVFFELNGTSTNIFYNAQDTIYFRTLDASGNIILNDFILSPDGQLTDTEMAGGQLHFLINKEFATGTTVDNPIRILTLDASLNVLTNTIFTGLNPLAYTDMAIDGEGNYYVVAKKLHSINDSPNGVLIKISGGSISYENYFDLSNLTEIQLDNSILFASGYHRDYVEDCETGSAGICLFLVHSNSLSNFEIVTPHSKFNVGNIKTRVSYSSDNFSDLNSIYSHHHSSGANTIYYSRLLVSGTDITDNIRSTCYAYRNVYAAGPVTNQNDYTAVERDKWERVWVVSRAQIDAHIQAYMNGDAGYKTPEVILNWPGNGDPMKGQSQIIAPFQDLNDNMIYEPLLGEYPLIKGDYCALSIYNDVNIDTSETCILIEDRMNVEIHEFVYGFECSQDSSLQNSIFVYYEIINKSTEAVFETFIGHFIDYDIMNANDDYVSSDPIRGINYGRNGDGTGPEQAYLILASNSNEDGIDNASGIGPLESPNGFGYGDGIVDNERMGMTSFVSYTIGGGVTGDPQTPEDYNNYLQAIWQNGDHVLYGGNGYNIGVTTIESNFMFTGDSDNSLFYSTNGVDPGFNWSEESAGISSGDRRGISGSGPFTFDALDTLFFDVAFITGMESISGGYTSHEAMIASVDSVKYFFSVDSLPCGQNFDFYSPFDGVYPSLYVAENYLPSPTLFPNPTSGNVTIVDLPENANIILYNLAGELILNINVNSKVVNFDFTELTSGLYFVQIRGDLSATTIKFVKH